MRRHYHAVRRRTELPIRQAFEYIANDDDKLSWPDGRIDPFSVSVALARHQLETRRVLMHQSESLEIRMGTDASGRTIRLVFIEVLLPRIQ